MSYFVTRDPTPFPRGPPLGLISFELMLQVLFGQALENLFILRLKWFDIGLLLDLMILEHNQIASLKLCTSFAPAPRACACACACRRPFFLWAWHHEFMHIHSHEFIP